MRWFFYSVFAFDLETCNVENSEYSQPYAAGVSHPKNLYRCFNRDLNEKELAFERIKVHVFYGETGNPVIRKIDYVMNKHKGKAK